MYITFFCFDESVDIASKRITSCLHTMGHYRSLWFFSWRSLFLMTGIIEFYIKNCLCITSTFFWCWQIQVVACDIIGRPLPKSFLSFNVYVAEPLMNATKMLWNITFGRDGNTVNICLKRWSLLQMTLLAAKYSLNLQYMPYFDLLLLGEATMQCSVMKYLSWYLPCIMHIMHRC